MARPLLLHSPCRNQDGGCPSIPTHCGRCSHPWPCPAVAKLAEAADERRKTPGVPDDIHALIERSSLGTPEAKAIRESADPALVERVMQRVREQREDPR